MTGSGRCDKREVILLERLKEAARRLNPEIPEKIIDDALERFAERRLSMSPMLWAILLWRALPQFSIHASINWEYVAIIGATLATCVGLATLGQTDFGAHRLVAFKRSTEIEPLN